jgi:signal transduction histidine kinase
MGNGQKTTLIDRITAWLMPLAELQPVDWLRYLGLMIWGLVALVLLLLPLVTSEPLSNAYIIAAWAAGGLFLLAFLHPSVARQQTSGLPWRIALLATMSLSALAVNFFTSTGLGTLLVMVVTALLPWLLPALLGMAWVGALALVFGGWALLSPEGGVLLSVAVTLTMLGLILLPFVASLLALRQVEAKADLRRVNAQLLATQSLLADQTRVSERLRISRDLHDLVGHHLTGLTLHLEVASHTTDGKAKQHVDQAAAVARLLLSDVREVVGDLRSAGHVNLRPALEMLAEGVPELAIHLEVPDEMAQIDPAHAQILLRCAQEIITNTVRHARANNLWIALMQDDEGLSLSAHDDGQGVIELMPGHGLNGMRERLRALGGRLDLSAGYGVGFRVRAWMPTEPQR